MLESNRICYRSVTSASQRYCFNSENPLFTGLPGGDRTPDPQLRRLMLYPTELRAVA